FLITTPNHTQISTHSLHDALPIYRFSLGIEDFKTTYGQLSLEYVHDNTLNPASNIWQGLRYKIFMDWFTQLSDVGDREGKFLFKDRKSTRLNSSHVKISYAVFCLK